MSVKKYSFGLIALFIIASSSVLLYIGSRGTNTQTSNQIRFVSLGDSYTIGQGLPSQDTWPVLLIEKLRAKEIKIVLVANPSVTGWTTQDLIDRELPIYDSSDPDFATLLIGVNDWIQGVDEDTFRRNLRQIIDRMQKKLPNKNHLILVTIPDFSVTATGKIYDTKGKASLGLKRFNDIIKEEGKLRNLPVVDIFPITQEMKNDPSLVNPDGLHPSRSEYKLWTDKIFPAALKTLQD